MKSFGFCCDKLYQHGRRRNLSSLTTSIIITLMCILLSSIIVLITSSNVIGTSNNHSSTGSVDKSSASAASHSSNNRSVLRRGSGVTASNASVLLQSSGGHHLTTTFNNPRKLQTSERRCITISIFLDQYPADTSWIIFEIPDDSSSGTSSSNSNTVATSSTYDDSMASSQQTEIVCLAAPGSYSFVIFDDYEDGICCEWGNGYYNVTVTQSDDADADGQVLVLASGGAWIGPNETTKFMLVELQPPPLTEVPSFQPSDTTTLHPSNVPSLIPSITYIPPSLQPTMYMNMERINATAQVNIYLTGVPSSDQNMTIDEQQVFETVFYTVLKSRLETVNVDVTEVLVDTQINDPDFVVDSPFDSENIDEEESSDDLAKLQLITNITFTYSDPPPFDSVNRTWSMYLSKWIESFGPTVADIFTDPKQDLYPNEKFFNTIIDVSATHVIPPNTDPTMSPTSSPTYLAAPEYKKPLVTGLASAGVLVVVLFFGGVFWCKYRKLKLAKRTHNVSGSGDIVEEREKEEEEGGRMNARWSLDTEESNEEELFGGGALWRKYRKLKMASRTHNVSSSGDIVEERENEEEEEGGRRKARWSLKTEESDEEEHSLVKDDNVLVLPSTVLYSTSDSDNEEEQDDTDDDRGDNDEPGREEDAHIETVPTVLEKTPPPQEPLSVTTTVSNGLLDDSAQYDEIVAAVLANNPNLTQVVLDNKHQIGNNDGGEALWQALTTNSHVKVLSLRNSNITDEQMAALALALYENASISTLSLQNNIFTSEGVEYLVVCLDSNNSTLKMIELEGNSNVDPSILYELQGILQSRRGPEEGGASSNHAQKIESLLVRIQGNDPNLTQLNLRGMGIGRNDTNTIVDALAGNVNIHKVDLSSNMIDDNDVSALSLALAENTSITHLCLADNRITTTGAEYLLCALGTNDTIADVDLTGNVIAAEVIAELNHALSQRKTAEL